MEFILKRKVTTKSLRIIVRPDATIEVCAPLNFSLPQIKELLKKKARWIKKHTDFFLNQAKSLDTSAVSQSSFESCRYRARKFVMERVKILNQSGGFNFNRIVIKNQRSKWGSCSSLKNLNFNYRILFLPIELADYLIAHELCHLKELNHSARFWRLVQEILPDYRARERELKKYSMTLNGL